MATWMRITLLASMVVIATSQRPVRTSMRIQEGADIVFILDGSGSTKCCFQSEFVPFMTRVAERLTLGPEAYQVGVVQFGNAGRIEINLDWFYNANSFQSNASGIQHMDENTNTTGGIYETIRLIQSDEHGSRDKEWAKIGILLTDGKVTYDKHRLNNASMTARQSGINIIPIGIGSQPDDAELFAMAQREDVVMKVQSFDSLLETDFIEDVVDVIKGVVRNDPLKNFRPEEEREAADVVFILDASESITEATFDTHYLPLVTNVTSRLALSNDGYQVSVITYGNAAALSMQFKEEQSEMEIRDQLDGINYADGMTNTSGALRMFRSLVTSPSWSSSDRQGVPVVGVLVTDGYATVDPVMVIPEAMMAKDEGLKLMAVATGDESTMDKEILEAVVSEPAMDHLLIASQRQDIVDVLVDNIQTIAKEQEPVTTTMRPTTTQSSSTGSFQGWSCDFEDSAFPFCDMVQSTSDDFDWTRHSGNTRSFDTGPYGAKSGQYYIYIETTGEMMNNKASIYLPRFSSIGDHCVSFFYNMYGFHVNKLALVKRFGSGDEIWIKENDRQGNFDWRNGRWHEAKVDVELMFNDQLEFDAYSGAGHTGDIALDMIEVKKGTC